MERRRERDWSALSSWSACQSRSARPEWASASCGLCAVRALCQIHNTIKRPSSFPPSISLNASMHQPPRHYADLFKPRDPKSNYPLEKDKSQRWYKNVNMSPAPCLCLVPVIILLLCKLELVNSNAWYERWFGAEKQKREREWPWIAPVKLSSVKWQWHHLSEHV